MYQYTSMFFCQELFYPKLKKKIIKGVKLVIAIYKNSSDKYVPIYDGEYVVDFGKVAQ